MTEPNNRFDYVVANLHMSQDGVAIIDYADIEEFADGATIGLSKQMQIRMDETPEIAACFVALQEALASAIQLGEERRDQQRGSKPRYVSGG